MSVAARFFFFWLPRGPVSFTPPQPPMPNRLLWGSSDELLWGSDQVNYGQR